MKYLLWTVIFCCGILPFTLRAQETQATDTTSVQQINVLRAELIDSFNKRDVDRLLNCLDNDVIVTWQSGEVCKGKQAVKDFYNRMMTGNQSVVESVTCAPIVDGRHIYGDTSVSYGSLGDEFKLRDGTELPLHSHFSATLVKDHDRWLVASFHVSTNMFDNPVLGAPVKKTAFWTGGVALVAWIAAGVYRRPQRVLQTQICSPELIDRCRLCKINR